MERGYETPGTEYPTETFNLSIIFSLIISYSVIIRIMILQNNLTFKWRPYVL